MVEEKQIVEKLFKQINSNSGLGTYGLNEVMNYLRNNVVDTIIVTDKIGLYRIESKCKRCNDTQERSIYDYEYLKTLTCIGAEASRWMKNCPELT